MTNARQDFTDKQITFLFLAKHYGLEKVSNGWKEIGKDEQTTGPVIDFLWNCDLVEAFKDGTPVTDSREANRMSISAAGIKLLDELCAETGIYFPDGATHWQFTIGVWRIDYNYRYKKYSFYKWEEVEEVKTDLEKIFDL
jgi:hypothetical protein